MEQLEILQAARTGIQNITLYFAQMVTITFAMVIGIYYFLNEARLGMKVFAFVVYVLGMALYFFTMLIESNLAFAARAGLWAIPAEQRAIPVQAYLELSESWVMNATSALLNVAILVLTAGTGWLLFFWRKHPPAGPEAPAEG